MGGTLVIEVRSTIYLKSNRTRKQELHAKREYPFQLDTKNPNRSKHTLDDLNYEKLFCTNTDIRLPDRTSFLHSLQRTSKK